VSRTKDEAPPNGRHKIYVYVPASAQGMIWLEVHFVSPVGLLRDPYGVRGLAAASCFGTTSLTPMCSLDFQRSHVLVSHLALRSTTTVRRQGVLQPRGRQNIVSKVVVAIKSEGQRALQQVDCCLRTGWQLLRGHACGLSPASTPPHPSLDTDGCPSLIIPALAQQPSLLAPTLASVNGLDALSRPVLASNVQPHSVTAVNALHFHSSRIVIRTHII
jgi:hypothetical protein